MIPLCKPCTGREELEAVREVLESGQLSRGPRCEQFEADICGYTGARHAVSLNSCSSALHLALLAHGIGPGDLVAVPTMTYCATVNAVLMVGATPVFVDCGYDYNTRFWGYNGVKAAIGVDMHGLPCDLSTIPAGVIKIRDAAHSLGAPGVGSDGVTTCLSFYASKNITCGDGGALLTNDPAIAEKVRRLSWFGRTAGEADIQELGYKANLTDIAAAIAIEQLKKLPAMLASRRSVAQVYNELLKPLAKRGLLMLPPWKETWHLYAIRVANRDQVAEQLKARGIGTSVHFRPLHSFEYLKTYATGSYRIAEMMGSQALSLPLYPSLLTAEIATVVEALTEILNETVSV